MRPGPTLVRPSTLRLVPMDFALESVDQFVAYVTLLLELSNTNKLRPLRAQNLLSPRLWSPLANAAPHVLMKTPLTHTELRPLLKYVDKMSSNLSHAMCLPVVNGSMNLTGQLATVLVLNITSKQTLAATLRLLESPVSVSSQPNHTNKSLNGLLARLPAPLLDSKLDLLALDAS